MLVVPALRSQVAGSTVALVALVLHLPLPFMYLTSIHTQISFSMHCYSYTAEVDVLHGCNDQGTYPDRCSILDLGLTCDDCLYDDKEGTITMGPGCSDTLSDVFNPDQTVKLFFDGWESTYEQEFFTLTFSDDWEKHDSMCAHPAVEVIMRSSFANMDVVAGDPNLGHCYYVDRTMHDTIYNNGCTNVTLDYNYHIVGMDYDPKSSYNVQVNAIHGCHPLSGIEDSC